MCYIFIRCGNNFSSINPKSKSLIIKKFPNINKWILSSFLPSIAQIISYFGSYLDQTFLYSFCFLLDLEPSFFFLLKPKKILNHL